MTVKTAIINTAIKRRTEQRRMVPKLKRPKVSAEIVFPNLPEAMRKNMIKPGEVRGSDNAQKGKTLMSRIREILRQRSLKVDPESGTLTQNTRFDDVAEAFVQQMEGANFQHTREFIEREEGKTPDRVIMSEDAIKVYIDLPEEPLIESKKVKSRELT
jgi:hypothetical protein